MMGRPRANEIPELIRQLGSRDRIRVDAARARLSVIGERAVEHLIEALEGNDHRVRARVMPLLALIQDSRSREPLTAMLLDRSPGLRAIAARGLARFPCSNSVRALSRLLERETAPSVKIAAVHALVESYEAGCEDALGPLLRFLGFPHESARIRLAAMSVLRALPTSQRAGILSRLEQDGEPAVRERARELAASPPPEGAAAAASGEIERLLAELGSPDYAQWNEAVRRLGAIGAATVRPLVTEMLRRSTDAEYCTRAGMALKALGPRRARALGDALDVVDEPLPLQVLVEVVGAVGEKSLVYRLADVIERIANGSPRPSEPDPLQRVRAKAHLELARVGSRVAIRDLRESLAARGGRIEPELLAAVERVGKREELGLLLRVLDDRDEFIRRAVVRAVRAIMKRERIRRNSRSLQSLSAEQRSALDRILSRSPDAAHRRPRIDPEP